MPAPKTKIKDNAIADLEADLETLQERHAQATSGVEEARQRLDELAARRGVIATDAYFGDEDAITEVKALDTETADLTRSVALALAAAASLEGAITDAKERLAKERVRVSGEQVAQLRAERQAVREEALRAADELLAVLAQDRALHAKMISAAQQGASSAGLEAIARNHDGAGLHRALGERLRGYAQDWV